jgi:AP2-associated kinase
LEADLNKHTTLQYRAPEMCDVWSRKGVGLAAGMKLHTQLFFNFLVLTFLFFCSDVWALGVLLYKLCYYTTPFESHGVLAIQNVRYTIPPFPAYSDNIKQLFGSSIPRRRFVFVKCSSYRAIGSMLKESASQRPTITQVYARVCQLRGIPPKPEIVSVQLTIHLLF